MPPEPSLIEAKHLKLLTNATGGLGHTGTTLYAHLVGTARLLETWGRPLDVCLAGLCHSIYGTQSYAEAAVSELERSRIRAVIGERAERLAHLFCIADRTTFIPALCAPEPEIRERAHNTGLPVSRHDLAALVEIELANYVEFMPRVPLTAEELGGLQENLEHIRQHISPEVYRAALTATNEHSPLPAT